MLGEYLVGHGGPKEEPSGLWEKPVRIWNVLVFQIPTVTVSCLIDLDRESPK